MTRAELLQKAKPILFNTDMVRAILDGRKTVTRRVLKKPFTVHSNGYITKPKGNENLCPYEPPYKVNDVLYVRETWQSWSCAECDWECVPDNGNGYCTMPKYLYRASDEETDKGWKPSIHMPKEAARLFLRVTNVRVEKLRDMELEDFIAEGITLSREEMKDYNTALYKARELFKDLWNSTCVKKGNTERYAYNWYGNPFVWVIEFEVITAEQAKGE